MAKVAQASALAHVGTGGHSELQRLLNVIAIVVPLKQEGRERAVASADRRHELDVEVALRIPNVLAVGEVRAAAAAHGEQHVLDARLMGKCQRTTSVIVGVNLDAPRSRASRDGWA